jgi:DNA-binding response OmpR family regulator
MTDVQFRPITHAAQFGEFSLDFRKMELCRADQPIGLTLREFKVLKFLVSRPSVVISRQKLIVSAWPKRRRSSYRTVDNCIAKLRQKIEHDPDCPVLIRTVHGVGYKFVPQETVRPSSQSLAEHISEGTWESQL